MNRCEAIRAGDCVACDQETPLIGAGPCHVALSCGHEIPLPPGAPVSLRVKASGVAVGYADRDTLRRIQTREGKA